MDEVVIPDVVNNKVDEYEASKKISNKKALINLSQDPAGLQVFLDKSKKGKLKHTVDVVKCIDLYMKGVSVKDIAVTQNINPENKRAVLWLSKWINKYKPDIDRNKVAVFKEFRTEFMQQKQQELLEGMTQEKIDAASVKDLAFAHDKLFASERLQENKSTQNVAHKYSSLVEEIHSNRGEVDE